MAGTLESRCFAFVHEQSCGEWDNKTILQDADKMAAFLRAEIKEAHGDLVKALQESKRQLEAYELAASGEAYNSLQINDALALALTSSEA